MVSGKIELALIIAISMPSFTLHDKLKKLLQFHAFSLFYKKSQRKNEQKSLFDRKKNLPAGKKIFLQQGGTLRSLALNRQAESIELVSQTLS